MLYVKFSEALRFVTQLVTEPFVGSTIQQKVKLSLKRFNLVLLYRIDSRYLKKRFLRFKDFVAVITEWVTHKKIKIARRHLWTIPYLNSNQSYVHNQFIKRYVLMKKSNWQFHIMNSQRFALQPQTNFEAKKKFLEKKNLSILCHDVMRIVLLKIFR